MQDVGRSEIENFWKICEMHGIKSDFLAGHPKNKRLAIVLDN